MGQVPWVTVDELLFGQEHQPETHPILRLPQRDLALVFPPDGNRRPGQTAVNRPIVLSAGRRELPKL